jgi:putative addiction module component (TIGR02574 family)
MACIDITTLSTDERLEFLDRLWESLASRPEAVAATREQQQELDRRLESLTPERGPGLSWDDFAEGIRACNPPRRA